jgi:predicted P-loop ATPase
VATVAEWAAKWPQCNWAVRTGDGLVVLDVDNMDALIELEDIPKTVVTTTGGGGQHYWFAATGKVRNSVSKITKGVDVRGDGGYVLVPPSGHKSGGTYEWDVHPDEQQLASMPRWMADAPTPPPSSTPDAPDAIIAGGRNKFLTGIAGSMRRKGCDADAIEAALSVMNQQRCAPPLPGDEVSRICKSISQYDPSDVDGVGSWVADLMTDRQGTITKDRTNVGIILTHHDKWKGALAYDSFASRPHWAKAPPSLDSLRTPAEGEDLSDWNEVPINQWFIENYGVSFSKDAIFSGMEAASKNCEFDPLLDYLNGLEWDGVPRVARWLHLYLGAEDCEYSCSAGKWWMISAVARAFDPGCQADHLLVLEGPQGAGKSTVVKLLCGKDWFLGSLPDIRNKDALAALAGHWIVEIGELDALKGANATRVKDFVSQAVDEFRPAYGRFMVKRPRRCVFVGTTNELKYLSDATGARRFWPVSCGYINRDAMTKDRDQLWAEAVSMYKAGDKWWPEFEDEKMLVEMQDERHDVDEWEGPIAEWCQGKEKFLTTDVLKYCLHMPDEKDWNRGVQVRVGRCMYRLGYIKKRMQGKDGMRKYYYVLYNTFDWAK